MKQSYNIEIDCANCAMKVEEACKKVQGVLSLTVNYMTQKMNVEFAENADETKTLKLIKKTGKKIEDEFEIDF